MKDIESEAERIVAETYKPVGGDYLWSDVVGAVATAIYEERKRNEAAIKPLVDYLSDAVDSNVGSFASAALKRLAEKTR